MSLPVLRLSDDQIDELAFRRPGDDTLRLIRAGQASRRRLLLLALRQELTEARAEGVPETFDLLARAAATAPDLVERVVTRPLAAASAVRSLRELRTRPRGPREAAEPGRPAGPATTTAIGYARALAAATAIRAGLPFEVDVPAPGGSLFLPEVGTAHGLHCATVTVTGDRGGFSVGCPHLDVPGSSGPHWRPRQAIPVDGEPPWSVELEDQDPARDCFDHRPAGPLDAASVDAVRAAVNGGWRLLAADHPEYARVARACLRSVVPLAPTPEPPGPGDATAEGDPIDAGGQGGAASAPGKGGEAGAIGEGDAVGQGGTAGALGEGDAASEGDEGDAASAVGEGGGAGAGDRVASASSELAFGCIAMTPSVSPETAALLIMHETQHNVLGAVLDLAGLVREPGRELHHAPWRLDPRPPRSLLQGAYAHSAVTDYWRVRWRRGAAGQAGFEFAYWREATTTAIGTLRRSTELTRTGRRLVDGMWRAAADWWREDPPRPLVLAARQVTAADAVLWRVRNCRPVPGLAPLLRDAYARGADCPALPASEVLATAPTPARHTRIAAAIRRRAVRQLSDDSSPGTDDGEKLAGYRRRVADDPSDDEAWPGLAHYAGRLRNAPAATVLAERPELVRAVLLAYRDDPAAPTAPPPEELAEWLAGGQLRDAVHTSDTRDTAQYYR
ncbi:aKG-HExxH-type peptide beta-hydroxylase [Plantactinospora endophytica]|uniref:aKG-HExxH-type peptide beta-hydroxylase n=1 Tax=Plantactinospora endophytica TaxID=673535 RepID=UPI003626DD9D